MKRFLEVIADDVKGEELRPGNFTTFVFPTRRASYLFKEILKKKFSSEIFFMPPVFSVEDFLASLTRESVTDDISLVLELFHVYKNHNENIGIEKFYSWGNVILKDFDEIDKNLVDHEKLYANLQNLAELELMFSDDEETLEALREFSKLFQGEQATELSRKFLRSWKVMGKVYADYQDVLTQKGMNYPGRLYKKVSELINEGSFQEGKYVFAGFNALTRSEESIINTLLDHGKAVVYFDADRSYLQDTTDEAGKYLRGYYRKWKNRPSVNWVIEDMYADVEKCVNIVGVSQKAAQAKILPDILQELEIDDVSDLPKTAVVLGDENLLMPVAYSIPESIESYNITTGYPLKNTSVYHLIHTLFQIQLKSKRNKDFRVYKSSEIQSLIQNQLIQKYLGYEATQLRIWLQSNRVNKLKSTVLEELKLEGLSQLLASPGGGKEFLIHLESEMSKLYYRIRSAKDKREKQIEEELLFYSVAQLKSLILKLSSGIGNLSLEFTFKLWSEAFQSLKIPFRGEPVSGLQIMGFLETRSLDFENLVILSVNENKIPSSSVQQTFIPFGIRKAFKLQTFKEKEAVFAYHFKRVLQRAKNIFLVFDTEVAIDGSGEQSRYLKQLIHEKSKGSILFEIKQKTVLNGPPKDLPESTVISIEKDTTVLDLLQKFTADGEKLLSPTKLVDYIECKLKFYLKHVAGFPEEDTDPGNIDPALFGNIFHRALEILFEPYIGHKIDLENLKDMAESLKIEQAVEKSLEDNKLIGEYKSIEGREQLLIKIISKAIEMILVSERNQVPFVLEGLEDKVELMRGDVRLGGYIDRIDKESESAFRIIDYKTGKVELVKGRNIENLPTEEYINIYFTNPKFKAGFQVYYYALLVRDLMKADTLTAGIYSVRALTQGLLKIQNGNPLQNNQLDEFSNRLNSLIQEIYDPGLNFDQTQEVERCIYCSYKTICNR